MEIGVRSPPHSVQSRKLAREQGRLYNMVVIHSLEKFLAHSLVLGVVNK